MPLSAFRAVFLLLVLSPGAAVAQVQNDGGGAAADAPAARVDAPAKWSSLFRDSEDGKFDTSDWLLGHHGFLPVPIIVTDPALGKGGGLTLAYFHRPAGASTTRQGADGRTQMVAPNVFALGGMRTSNGSEAVFAGASMHFKDDTWRYRGGVVSSSINLGFYGPSDVLPELEIDYNTDGLMSFQQVSRRLGDRQLYLGLAWIYMDQDLSFDRETDRQLFDDRQLASTVSALDLSLKYDSRDNAFTPSSGWLGMVQGAFYDDVIGSDSDYQSYRAHGYMYWPLGEFVIGGRADVRWAQGDVPFYRLPYIDLRGIGSARYQDTRASVLETEVRWNLDGRWSLIGFVGAGRTWGRKNSFGDGRSEVSKGGGVRYLLARKLGLYGGIDYAWGPEDGTFYITTGSAWR